jgi:RHS repeat-associated protein
MEMHQGDALLDVLITKYTYDDDPNPIPIAGVVRETPATETLPDGTTKNTYFKFDQSATGPTEISLDSTGSLPKQLRVQYYADGNLDGKLKASGELGRAGQQYNYDASTRRLVSTDRLLDGFDTSTSTSWSNALRTEIDSHVSDGQLITDEAREKAQGRKVHNDYAGASYPQTTTRAAIALAGETLPASQVSCYHYSPDGRLEEAQLPEGNLLHYAYDAYGRPSSVTKGYAPAGTATSWWNQACGTATAPTNDPGQATIQTTTYSGGFLVAYSSGGNNHQIITDGFGRMIQDTTGSAVGTGASGLAVVQKGYDGAGRVAWEAALSPGSGIPTNSYQKPTATTTGLLAMTEYAYDDVLSRLTSVARWNLQKQESVKTTTFHDDHHRTVTVTERVVPWTGTATDPGRTTIRTLDGLGRLVSETLPAPNSSKKTITYSIDSQDLLNALVVQDTNQTAKLTRTYQYDSRGNLRYILDENGNQLSSATYDNDSNPLVTRGFGMGAPGATTRGYDRFGRLVSTSRELLDTNKTKLTSTYGWDRNDRRTSFTDATTTHAWTTTYSGLDQTLRVDGPLSTWKKYTYIGLDAQGSSDSNGYNACYRYDGDRQLFYIYAQDCSTTSSVFGPLPAPAIERTRFEHTALGQVSTVTATGDVQGGNLRPTEAWVSFSYDTLGRTLDETVYSGTSAVPSYIVHHDFNDAQTVTTSLAQNPLMMPPTPPATAPTPMWYASYQHHVDELGRLQKVRLNNVDIATYDYGTAGVGGPLWLTYSNQTKAQFHYDSKFRQTGIDVTFKPSSGQPVLVTSFHEVFGADSIPRMRQRQIGTGTVMTDVFQVDGDGRVSAENFQVPNVALLQGEIGNADVAKYLQSGGTPATNQRNYLIDGIGNWTSVTTATSNGAVVNSSDALSTLTSVGGQQMNIDTQNDLLGLQNDPIQFRFEQFSGSLLHAQNGDNQTNDYVYDALGRRALEKHSDGTRTALVWDGQTIVAHGDPTNLTIDVPSDDIDGHIASADQNGTASPRFYHQGPDQSVLAVSDQNGLVEGYSYSAFGEVQIWRPDGQTQSSSSAMGTRFLFQGQLYDPLTATYSMRAREYQPKWGRFLSPDPLGVGGGPSLYSFTGSRPLAARDPLGLDPGDISWGDPSSVWGFVSSHSPGNAGYFLSYVGAVNAGEASWVDLGSDESSGSDPGSAKGPTGDAVADGFRTAGNGASGWNGKTQGDYRSTVIADGNIVPLGGIEEFKSNVLQYTWDRGVVPPEGHDYAFSVDLKKPVNGLSHWAIWAPKGGVPNGWTRDQYNAIQRYLADSGFSVDPDYKQAADGALIAVQAIGGLAGQVEKALIAAAEEIVEGGEQLFHRLGTSYESPTRLARQAAAAEQAEIGTLRLKGLHGVSVSPSPPAVPAGSASAAQIEKAGFKLVFSPTAADPMHHTLILPNPVTREVADVFNALFGRVR